MSQDNLHPSRQGFSTKRTMLELTQAQVLHGLRAVTLNPIEDVQKPRSQSIAAAHRWIWQSNIQ
jgi:hypothetical protein